MVLVFQIILATTIIASGSILAGIGWGIWTLMAIREEWLRYLQLAVNNCDQINIGNNL